MLLLSLILSPHPFLYPLVAAGGTGGSVSPCERGTCCGQEGPSLLLPRFHAPSAAAGTVLPTPSTGGMAPSQIFQIPTVSAAPLQGHRCKGDRKRTLFLCCCYLSARQNHLLLAQQWGSTGRQGEESLLVLGAGPCCPVLPQTRQLQDLLCAQGTG